MACARCAVLRYSVWVCNGCARCAVLRQRLVCAESLQGDDRLPPGKIPFPGHRHRHRHRHTDTRTQGHKDTETKTQGHKDTRTHRHTQTHTDTDRHKDTRTQGHKDTRTQGHRHRHRHKDTDTKTHRHGLHTLAVGDVQYYRSLSPAQSPVQTSLSPTRLPVPTNRIFHNKHSLSPTHSPVLMQRPPVPGAMLPLSASPISNRPSHSPLTPPRTTPVKGRNTPPSLPAGQHHGEPPALHYALYGDSLLVQFSSP
eukprot:3839535-Rhodomonas_salina.1